jgi:hypothetical protein
MLGMLVHIQSALTAALLLAVSGANAIAGTTATAHAHVAIRIGPIAEISFPKGTNFTIVVPDAACRPGFDHDPHHHDSDHNSRHSYSHPNSRHLDSIHDLQRAESGTYSANLGRYLQHVNFNADPYPSSFGGDPHPADLGRDPRHSDSDHNGHPFDHDRDPPRPGSDHDPHHCDTSGWSPIPPVRIPFLVKGNALASVSAIPDSFLRIKPGFYLGKAVSSHGQALGYQIMVRFPFPRGVSDWDPDWSGPGDWNILATWPGFRHLSFLRQISQLPGANGVGTPALSAEVGQSNGSAAGIIYIVSANDWTAWGDQASPGFYRGSIEVTVTAAQ